MGLVKDCFQYESPEIQALGQKQLVNGLNRLNDLG